MKPILSRRTRVSPSSSSPARGAPSIVTVPCVGRSRPPTRFRRVDLPEPEGPMIDTISPRGIAMETSSSATTSRLPANRLVTRSRPIMSARVRLCEQFHKRVNRRLHGVDRRLPGQEGPGAVRPSRAGPCDALTASSGAGQTPQVPPKPIVTSPRSSTITGTARRPIVRASIRCSCAASFLTLMYSNGTCRRSWSSRAACV